MKVYFASDHAGFELKNALVEYVRGLEVEVEDLGAYTLDKEDDYPRYMFAAARAVAGDLGSRAIILGGSGQGEAMAANRVKGLRAAVYYGEPAHKQTDADGNELDVLASIREHNDANVLSLGARFLSESEAKTAVKRWLDTPFSAEARHERRIKELDQKSDE
ncbi:MAG: RpiB/LacA/LacB family sugar-phosphate isomerase [Minisyncoccia bacterium]